MKQHLLTHKNLIIGGCVVIIGVAVVIAGDVIVPGNGNTATGVDAVVVSGISNDASGQLAGILGGGWNSAEGIYSTIGGGANNTASGYQSTIGGGYSNTASESGSTIGGGYSNTASGYRSTIGGGTFNTASGYNSTIGGGSSNTATGSYAVVVSGIYNDASGDQASILAGEYNSNDGTRSAILGGKNNAITAVSGSSSILAGRGNVIEGLSSSILAGTSNSVLGTNSVASGYLVTVESNLTFAHAREITIAGEGVTLFSDNDPNNERVASDTLSDSWTMYGIFENGYQFFTDSGMTTGAQLVGGATAWSAMSDRNAKCEFGEVDPVEVLKKVAAMPMTTWSYKHDDKQTRYMGVMAQDLHGAFGLGHDDKTINTLVADGVAMAAIQGLNTLLEEKDAEMEELREKIAALEKAIGNR